MALIEVDVVGAQAPQRRLAGLDDVLARQPAVVRALAGREVHLGGQDVRAAVVAAQRPADDPLGVAAAVHVGGVEEVDAELVGAVDARLSRGVLDVPAVGQPRPQRDLGDLHAGGAEAAVVHGARHYRAMAVEIRTVEREELPEWLAAQRVGFHPPQPPPPQPQPPAANFAADTDFRRLHGAFDSGRVVATFRSYATELTVPGGRVRADAITNITVAATHRRQGLLSSMMHADLAA